MNFKNFGNDPSMENGSSGRPPGNFPLMRQSSIYSLTFDELTSTGGISKDFGSMNMDELLKNIWTAEELHTFPAAGDCQGGTAAGVGGFSGVGPVGNLTRQGSLTLPRTLSQKTVDEVWRDISKEYVENKDGNAIGGGSNFPQRQQTLGEMTLEEFLARAGVVREDNQLAAKPNVGVFGDFASQGQVNTNGGLNLGFQQANKNRGLTGISIPVLGSDNQMNIQSSTNLPLNVSGIRSSQQHQQVQVQQRPQPPQQTQRHQQQIFPKQPAMHFATQMASPKRGQLSSPGSRNGILGIGDQGLSSALIQGSAMQGGGMGMAGMGPASVTVATLSPANQLSSDGNGKSQGDTSSVSPIPYMFNGGVRGRRSNAAVEKVVERRHRRMIKNRESAARSRARKQAYTVELEAEVAKLKEENEALRKKQEEIVEMQKNQVMEMMNMQHGVKRRCLRRTQTGPW